MKSAPWVVGLLMVALTVIAVALIPTELPPSRPAAPGGSGAPRRPIRPVWNAVEQVSPIAGADGTLVQALGIETPGGEFKPVIIKGERTPVTRTFALATAMEDQSEMLVHVCRGNSTRASENESLGWFRVAGIPPGPANETLIGLVFKVADNAIVGAAVTRDGRPLEFRSSPAPQRP